jgi:hypothetical protein
MARVLFSALLVALATACTCGTAAPDEPALDRAPSPRPEGWAYELRVAGDGGLDVLRAQLPEGATRAAFPGLADLLEALVPVPAAARSALARDSELRCIAVRRGEGAPLACAVRVDALEGATYELGGPRGARWITGEAGAALAGDVLVLADTRELVALALPWLVFPDEPIETTDPVELEVAADVPAQVLRPATEQQLASATGSARETIAHERAAHEAPPTLGEPEALVTALAGFARERVALLTDLGAVHVSISPTPQGLALRARGRVAPGTPLARRLESATLGAPLALAAVPEGTVLAAWSRGVPDPPGRAAALVGTLSPIAGERLSSEDRAALERALAGWEGARGEDEILALGAGEGGAWLLVGSPRSGATLDPAALHDAVGLPWPRTVLGALAGCAAEDSACPVVSLLAEPSPLAVVHGAGGAPDLAAVAAALASGLSAGGRTAPPGTSVDLERDLAALPAGTFAAWLLYPGRVPALLARVSPGLRSWDDAGGALVIALVREGDQLLLEARASRAALEDLRTFYEIAPR